MVINVVEDCEKVGSATNARIKEMQERMNRKPPCRQQPYVDQSERSLYSFVQYEYLRKADPDFLKLESAG